MEPLYSHPWGTTCRSLLRDCFVTVHLGPGCLAVISQLAFIQGWPLRGVPLYMKVQKVSTNAALLICQANNVQSENFPSNLLPYSTLPHAHKWSIWPQTHWLIDHYQHSWSLQARLLIVIFSGIGVYSIVQGRLPTAKFNTHTHKSLHTWLHDINDGVRNTWSIVRCSLRRGRGLSVVLCGEGRQDIQGRLSQLVGHARSDVVIRVSFFPSAIG